MLSSATTTSHMQVFITYLNRCTVRPCRGKEYTISAPYFPPGSSTKATAQEALLPVRITYSRPEMPLRELSKLRHRVDAHPQISRLHHRQSAPIFDACSVDDDRDSVIALACLRRDAAASAA